MWVKKIGDLLLCEDLLIEMLCFCDLSLLQLKLSFLTIGLFIIDKDEHQPVIISDKGKQSQQDEERGGTMKGLPQSYHPDIY